MPRHSDRLSLPYPPDLVLALVADVARYPEFLPWCVGARLRERQSTPAGEIFIADLIVAFKGFRDRYTSRVTVTKPHEVRVDYISGPFKHLDTLWHFSAGEAGGTHVDFTLDFEFRNPILQALIGRLFEEAVEKMTGAFLARAHALYGADAARAP